MPYLGSTPNASFSSRTKQDFTANGSTTAFTLSSAVASANDIEVFVGNVRQEPTEAYTVSGTTLNMSEAPETGLNFYVVFKQLEENSVVPADGTISTAKISSGAVTKSKIGTTELDLATIKDSTGTNTAITIDSDGRVNAPSNPKFSVQLAVNSASADYTTTSNVLFDTIDFNVGNCVAISNSVATFTAPITGYYQFNLMVGFGQVNDAQHASTYLVIDGEAAENDTYRNIEDMEGGTYQTSTTAALIYLTANQTVNPVVFIHTDTSVNIRPGSRFSGFLVA